MIAYITSVVNFPPLWPSILILTGLISLAIFQVLESINNIKR